MEACMDTVLYSGATVMELTSGLFFSFNQIDGTIIYGSLGLAANGKIYRHTQAGGVGDSCVIFQRWIPLHSSIPYYARRKLTSVRLIPNSGLTQYTDGTFYGTDGEGGAYSNGVIFHLDPSTNTYTDLYDFDTTGGFPTAELLLAPDGKFYGGGGGGGYNHNGCIFKLDPVTNVYTPLFTPPAGTGVQLSLSRLLLATDGRFYSTNILGGYLFSYKPGDTTLTVIHQFNGATEWAATSGVIQAANGKIYGMTDKGLNSSGGNTYGEIYSYDISTDSFKVEFNFADGPGYGTPETFAPLSNGKLLGSTTRGGLYGFGPVFPSTQTPSNW